jgi:hypothetical protein
MARLNEAAKSALRDAGITQAAWVREHGDPDGKKWYGDVCGCPDDRCANGFHHYGEDDCGCRDVLITDYLREHREFGPVQFAEYLGLTEWQFSRARGSGDIPPPDRPRGRWSGPVADAVVARIADIQAAAGSIPDLGAVRAAEVLSARLGMVVTRDGISELGRQGLIPVAGYYKEHELYDGRAVESFTDVAAAEAATWAGHLRTTDESAAYLRVRRADLAHLVRAGLLRPADYGYGPYDRRRRPTVPLYRTGDLDALAADPGIDWAGVHATPAGRRSPLAALKTAGGTS